MPTEPTTPAPQRWSRNIFFVLACVGAAVGLGNLWRFPYLVGQNGGAAFILIYLAFVVIICLPIMVAGSSTAAVKRIMETRAWQGAGIWFRKGAGALICLLGIYFIVNPFVSS